MTRLMRSALPRLLAATVVLLLLVTSAPAAVKLVRMNNGRTLKARSVERDGEWVIALLDGGATVGFQASEVASVEDDPLGRDDLGTPTNVVTSGREVGRSSFRGNNSRQQAITQPPQVPEQEPQEIEQPEDAVPAQANPNAPQVNLGQPLPGQQPQQPASRFNRLGLRSRTGDN